MCFLFSYVSSILSTCFDPNFFLRGGGGGIFRHPTHKTTLVQVDIHIFPSLGGWDWFPVVSLLGSRRVLKGCLCMEQWGGCKEKKKLSAFPFTIFFPFTSASYISRMRKATGWGLPLCRLHLHWLGNMF